MTIRVLIADHHAPLRRLLRRLIETHADWIVCGDAEDGQQAITKAAELSPDVVLLDLSMPQKNGLEAAREISRNLPGTPMLLLTVQPVSQELTKEALHAGFKGAVSKNKGSQVVEAIETLLEHQNFFQPTYKDPYA